MTTMNNEDPADPSVHDTPRELPEPVAVLSSEVLGPCPCCGSAAAFGAATGDDEGAYFVYCTTAQCGLTTNLMFACMDDPKPILAERWNRRTVGGKCVSALEADLLEAKGYIEELDRENDRLRAALRQANDQAEHFARLWYLTNEDAGRYAFAKTLEGQVVTMETFKSRGAEALDQALDDAMTEAADAQNEAGYGPND